MKMLSRKFLHPSFLELEADPTNTSILNHCLKYALCRALHMEEGWKVRWIQAGMAKNDSRKKKDWSRATENSRRAAWRLKKR